MKYFHALILFMFCFYFQLNYSFNKLLITSIPKSGTWMLKRCLSLIAGRAIKIINTPSFVFINPRNYDGLYIKHATYIPRNITAIKNHSFITFFIYRDPRDQVVSWLRWHFGNDIFLDQNKFDQLLMYIITDGRNIWETVVFNDAKNISPTGISNFYKLYLPWRNHPAVLTTTYEKLVGEKGGGSKDVQLQEIQRIANWMGINLSPEQVEKAAIELYGVGHTFRIGKIGAWKQYFKEEHKKAFKKIAGQLLIDLGYEKDFDW